MIKALRDFASIFLPRKISIRDNTVIVSSLGELLTSQDITDLTGFGFEHKSAYTGAKVLYLKTSVSGVHYNGYDLGFKSLVLHVLKHANLSQEERDRFSNSAFPPDGFIWGKINIEE